MVQAEYLLSLHNVETDWHSRHLTDLAHLASDIWALCLERNIMVQVEHLLSLHNVEADWHSRHLTDGND